MRKLKTEDRIFQALRAAFTRVKSDCVDIEAYERKVGPDRELGLLYGVCDAPEVKEVIDSIDESEFVTDFVDIATDDYWSFKHIIHETDGFYVAKNMSPTEFMQLAVTLAICEKHSDNVEFDET